MLARCGIREDRILTLSKTSREVMGFEDTLVNVIAIPVV